MLATLGTLEFVGDGASAVYTIGRDGLVGYFEGVGASGEQIQRTSSDGYFDSPMLLTGRLITISGLVRASTPAAFEAALNGLAAISVRDLTMLRVQTDSSDTWAMVRRIDKPDVSVQAFGTVAAYRLSLLAPDPRRYGAAQPTVGPGASLTVSHAGDGYASPKVTVAGPQTAPYTVASEGHSVTIGQGLGSGQTHVIDMETGFVYRDGVLQPGVYISADTFQIPPGAGATVTGPAGMTVDVTDTYV